MTDFIKKKEIKNNWILINAENLVVGRLAAYISKVLRDIRIALLEADVNLKVAKKFVQHVKEKALGEKVLNSVSPGQQFTKILFDELKYFLGDDSKELEFDSSGQTVIVLTGLQGCGKTTTCGKLARFLKNKGKEPFLIAADLQRPAAIDQLITLGKSIDIEVFSQKSKNPVNVVKAGIKEAKKLNKNVVIIDTAGRLHIDEEMMDQLKSMKSFWKQNDSECFLSDSAAWTANRLTCQALVS